VTLTHSQLIEAIVLAASESGAALLWKNNQGSGMVTRKGQKPTFMRWGVGPTSGGGLDLVGLRNSDGRFIMIDAKVGRDKLSEAQLKVIKWVRMRGGIAGEARSVEQAMELIHAG
jgi:hypothetical protein